MKALRLVPMMMMTVVPMLAIGCAASADETTGADEGAATIGAAVSADVKAAVGAVVVDGERLCTAALADVDAGAKIQLGGAAVSAAGRQIVFGGACVGKLKNGLIGAAAFVSQKNGVTLSTPILAFDFETQASAGLAVGILGEKSKATPLKLHGIAASGHAGIKSAALLHASDKNGLLASASASAEAGFDVALQTQCTSIAFGAEVGAGAGAGVQLRGGEDALALVMVDGQLQIGAHLDLDIDGRCVVTKIGTAAGKIATGTIEAANDFGDAFSAIGTTRDVVGAYGQKKQKQTVSVYLNKPAKVLRVNSQGAISATANGRSCRTISIGPVGASCEIAPRDGFGAGWVKVEVDLHENIFPDPASGQRVVLSTSDDALFPLTHD